MPALAVVGLVLGIGLIYAAVTGQSPVEEFTKAIRSGRVDGPDAGARPLVDPLRLPAGSGSNPGSLSGVPITSPPAGLVAIGNGHRLRSDAAAAFREWEMIYGRPIPITDSYRDYATQAAAHTRDPDRFAAASKSAHVDGLAVDVNLAALGITNGRIGDAKYDALYVAAWRAGWCTYTGGRSGHTWHFSFKGCR